MTSTQDAAQEPEAWTEAHDGEDWFYFRVSTNLKSSLSGPEVTAQLNALEHRAALAGALKEALEKIAMPVGRLMTYKALATEKRVTIPSLDKSRGAVHR